MILEPASEGDNSLFRSMVSLVRDVVRNLQSGTFGSFTGGVGGSTLF